MKTFTRFAIAAIIMLSVAFMSVNQVAWAANPAQTTGGDGSTHVDTDGGWFADFPNDSLPQGGVASLDPVPVTTPDVPSFPDTGHTLHLVSEAFLDTSTAAGMHLVCYPTPPSGGAIFWWEPTLHSWVPLANFQTYPTFSGQPYTCVNTWYTGTFAYGYVVP